MTIFSLQKFHQKAKNPRKRPIVSKFVVPKVPEVYDFMLKSKKVSYAPMLEPK